MHIPDGYLSPETCIAMYGAAAPFWYQASRHIKQTMAGRAAPLLAIFAALSFTIQMFNIPVPGGTTAHAIGGTLIAIVLGPWAAIVGVSISIVIQALFFGDGGITTLGANALNMAIALPLAGYATYRLLSRGAAPLGRRRVVAAAVAGYVGINVAGLLAALELGIQPLFWSEGGHALYNPYGLAVTLPAMALTHLTMAGFAEAALTALGLGYLWRSQPALFNDRMTEPRAGRHGRYRALVGILAALVLLAPIGLLASGGASFEWDMERLGGLLGYVPAGMNSLGKTWQAVPMPHYQLPASAGDASLLQQAPAYALSGGIGIALIFGLAAAAHLIMSRRAVEPSRQSGKRRRRADFLGKTVSGVTAAVERSIFSEEHARLPGLLQHSDPRAKVIATLLLLLTVAFVHDLIVVGTLYVIILILARLSHLPLVFFVRRVWLGVPLFAGMVVLPALFTLPGRPILALSDLGPLHLVVSDNGLASAALFIARVGTSASMAMLLVLTTRWAELLRALRVLHMPETFVTIIGMTYRYLFLFLHLTNSLFLARQSRTVGSIRGAEQRRWVAATAGALFGKSVKMSGDVHQAMLARGFAGEVRVVAAGGTEDVDWLLIGAALAVAAALAWMDRGLR